MKRNPHRFLSLVTAVVASVLGHAQPASASTIFWGSTIGDDVLIDSNGQPLGGEFSFELGVFDNGFVPTVANINDWAANWRVFDRAFDPTPTIPDDGDPEGWSEENQAFAGTVEHLSDGTSDSDYATPGFQFQQGSVVYLWVYNTKDRIPETEWALVTDGVNTGDTLSDWVFPDPAEVGGSYDWMLSDADEAVYGGLTDNGTGMTLQTVVVPVPEPSSVILLGVTVLGALLYRRRPAIKAAC